MKQFRFGILGAGGIAHKFCNAVGKVDDACVAAVASKDQNAPGALQNGMVLRIFTAIMSISWHGKILMRYILQPRIISTMKTL